VAKDNLNFFSWITMDFDLYLQRIKNGDELALEKVYKSSYKSLVNYSSDITGNPELAEEVVQDVFLKIWQTRSDLNIKGDFKSYLFRAVHNQSLNILRQIKTRKESVNLTANDKTWQFISENYHVEDFLIEMIFSDETEVIIERSISELPEQCRKVFLLSRIESIDNHKIAELLNLSDNTVRTHIYRALKKIAADLGLKK
jgi:RNA polymerase sigma-70 factor, ECF subfamily